MAITQANIDNEYRSYTDALSEGLKKPNADVHKLVTDFDKSIKSLEEILKDPQSEGLKMPPVDLGAHEIKIRKAIVDRYTPDALKGSGWKELVKKDTALLDLPYLSGVKGAIQLKLGGVDPSIAAFAAEHGATNLEMLQKSKELTKMLEEARNGFLPSISSALTDSANDIATHDLETIRENSKTFQEILRERAEGRKSVIRSFSELSPEEVEKLGGKDGIALLKKVAEKAPLLSPEEAKALAAFNEKSLARLAELEKAEVEAAQAAAKAVNKTADVTHIKTKYANAREDIKLPADVKVKMDEAVKASGGTSTPSTPEAAKSQALLEGTTKENYTKALNEIEAKHKGAYKDYKEAFTKATTDEQRTAAFEKYHDAIKGVQLDGKDGEAFHHLLGENGSNLRKALESVKPKVGMAGAIVDHGVLGGALIAAAGIGAALLIPGQRSANDNGPANENGTPEQKSSSSLKWVVGGASVALGAISAGVAFTQKLNIQKALKTAAGVASHL